MYINVCRTMWPWVFAILGHVPYHLISNNIIWVLGQKTLFLSLAWKLWWLMLRNWVDFKPWWVAVTIRDFYSPLPLQSAHMCFKNYGLTLSTIAGSLDTKTWPIKDLSPHSTMMPPTSTPTFCSSLYPPRALRTVEAWRLLRHTFAIFTRKKLLGHINMHHTSCQLCLTLSLFYHLTGPCPSLARGNT